MMAFQDVAKIFINELTYDQASRLSIDVDASSPESTALSEPESCLGSRRVESAARTGEIDYWAAGREGR